MDLLRRYLWLWVIIAVIFASGLIILIFIVINKCLLRTGKHRIKQLQRRSSNFTVESNKYQEGSPKADTPPLPPRTQFLTAGAQSYENLTEDYEQDKHDYVQSIPDYEQDKHDYVQSIPDYEQDKHDYVKSIPDYNQKMADIEEPKQKIPNYIQSMPEYDYKIANYEEPMQNIPVNEYKMSEQSDYVKEVTQLPPPAPAADNTSTDDYDDIGGEDENEGEEDYDDVG